MAPHSSHSQENPQTPHWRDHIRLRPAMYVGQLGTKGFFNLLREIMQHFFREAKSDAVSIQLMENYSAKMRFHNLKEPLVCYSDESNPVSIPHYPLSLLVLNSLSQDFRLSFFDREGNKLEEQLFRRGEWVQGNLFESISCSTIEINTKLDEQIWGSDFSWSHSFFSHQLQEFAYFYPRVTIKFQYEMEQEACCIIYHFRNGLQDKIDIEKWQGWRGSFLETSIDITIEDLLLQAAFAFRESSVDAAYLRSYVDDFPTPEHGTHVDGFLTGLARGLRVYCQQQQLADKHEISEHTIKGQLVAALNVHIETPRFGGSVKNKLENSEILEPIAKHVAEVFTQQLTGDEASAMKLLTNIEFAINFTQRNR